MCRSRILCFLLCLLLCSCLPVAAMAAEAPDGEEVAVSDFLRDLGFDPEDEDSVSDFLTWLCPLEPASEHDMSLILSGSAYSDLAPEKVYFLWQCLHDAIGDTDLYYASDGTGGVVGTYGYGYIRWSPDDPSKILISSRLPNNAFDSNPPVVGTIDLGAIMAQQGYLTQASLTPLETLISETNSLLSQSNLDLTFIYNRLGLVYNLLGVMGDKLSSLLSAANDIYTVLYTDPDGSIYSFLRRTDYNVLNLYNSLRDYQRSWGYDLESNGLKDYPSAANRRLPELIDMNFKDLDSLLLTNFRSSVSMPYFSGLNGSTHYFLDYLPEGSSLSDVLTALGASFTYSTLYSSPVLLDNGTESGLGTHSLISILAGGFLGLNRNIETALVGGHGDYGQYLRLTFDKNLNKSIKVVNYTDLLHAMVGIGSDIQNPLAQLQAVLAGDDDLELKRNTQENVDAVIDNFTGDGPGAVSGGDTSDASGLTAGVGESFSGNPVSADGAFQAVNDSGNYNFFSQETANALDSVTYPAAAVLADGDEDSWLEGYVADDEGFYTVGDQSGWNILDYLRGEG